MKKYEASTLGERLRTLRESSGMTQATLASLLRVSTNTIGNYEHDETNVPTRILQGYKEIFHISYDYLLDGKDISVSDWCKKLDSLPLSQKRFLKDLIPLLESYDLHKKQ